MFRLRSVPQQQPDQDAYANDPGVMVIATITSIISISCKPMPNMSLVPLAQPSESMPRRVHCVDPRL